MLATDPADPIAFNINMDKPIFLFEANIGSQCKITRLDAGFFKPMRKRKPVAGSVSALQRRVKGTA